MSSTYTFGGRLTNAADQLLVPSAPYDRNLVPAPVPGGILYSAVTAWGIPLPSARTIRNMGLLCEGTSLQDVVVTVQIQSLVHVSFGNYQCNPIPFTQLSLTFPGAASGMSRCSTIISSLSAACSTGEILAVRLTLGASPTGTNIIASVTFDTSL